MFCARCNRVFDDLTLRTCPTCHHRLAGPANPAIDRSPNEALSRWRVRFPHIGAPTTVRAGGEVHRHTHERRREHYLAESIVYATRVDLATTDEATVQVYTFADLISELSKTTARWEMMTLVGQVRLLGDPDKHQFMCIIASPDQHRIYEASRLIIFLHDFKRRFPLISKQPWRLMPVVWNDIEQARDEARYQAERQRLARR